MAADEKVLKKTEIQTVKHQYQEVNKIEVKFRGKIQVIFDFEDNKQTKLQSLITKKKTNTATGSTLVEEIQPNYLKHSIGREQPIRKKQECARSFQIYSRTTLKIPKLKYSLDGDIIR